MLEKPPAAKKEQISLDSRYDTDFSSVDAGLTPVEVVYLIKNSQLSHRTSGEDLVHISSLEILENMAEQTPEKLKLLLSEASEQESFVNDLSIFARKKYAHYRSGIPELKGSDFDNIIIDHLLEENKEYESNPYANYFTSLELAGALQKITDPDYEITKEEMPFEVGDGWFGCLVENNLNFYKPESPNEFRQEIQSYYYYAGRRASMTEESVAHSKLATEQWKSIIKCFEDEESLPTFIDDVNRDSLQYKEYEAVLDTHSQEKLREDFGFTITDFPGREQLFFLSYLKRIRKADVPKVMSFYSKYGIDGIRTFISLERGDETLGDSIVTFGQHDEVAGTVFKYYGELLNSAERAEALVKEVSDCEGEACADLANQVRENIVNRAQKDLEKAVRAHDPSEVAAQIENYVAAAKEYVALLQEVGTGKIESVSPEALTSEERVRMQELLRKNYDKAYPEPENEDFKVAVAGSLEKSFSNPDTSFRVLRDNGKIVSYNRFDTVRDFTGKEVSYFGSFNADPAYSGVGGVMLEETIKDQLETGRPMMAHCDPAQAITRKYIEDGFVATSFYELAGKPSFEIWRSKDSSAQLESKGRSIDELLESVGESGAVVVREQSESETYPELQNSMSLTRYFTHDGKTYLVFEILPDTLSEDFILPQEEQREAA